MKKTLLLLCFILCAGFTFSQPCNVNNTVSEISGLNSKGEFDTALNKSNELLECDDLTPDEEILINTWLFKLNRNLRKRKSADRAILRAKEIMENSGKSMDFEFLMLLVESSALRSDSVQYNKLLDRVKDRIFDPNLPEDHLSLGRYYFLINYKGNDAIPNFLKALSHFEQLDSIPVFHMGLTLRALGNKNRDRGDFDKSAEYYKRELELYKAHYPERHFDISICNFNIGNIGYEKLEFEEALKHYLAAEEIWVETYPPENIRMRSLNEAIGDMYWELGDHKNALKYFNRSTPYSDVVNNDISELTISSGDSLLQLGNYSAAINYYKEAVAWREQTYGEDHMLTGACQNFVARAVRSSGDIEGSLDGYQQAIIILVEEMNSKSWYDNPTLEMHIKSYQYLLEALSAKGELLKDLYYKSNDLKDLKAALETQEIALSVLEKIKNNQMSEASREFWASRTLSLIENTIHTSSELFNLTGNEEYIEKAFNFSERSKAILLLAALYDQDISSFSDVPNTIIEKERELKSKINEYNGKLTSEEKRCAQVREKMVQLYKTELQSLQNEYDLLISDIRINYPNYYHLKYDPEIGSLSSIQNELLDEHTTLLSYFAGETRLFVFKITSNDIGLRIYDNAEELYQTTLDYFQSLGDFEQLQANPQLAYELFTSRSYLLYTKLLEPEIEMDSQRRLIIIPDGSLSYLPFETLLTSKVMGSERDYAALDYLLRSHAISYAPSASTLLIANKAKRKNTGYFGFAPNYTNAEYGEVRNKLSNLEFNEPEVSFAAGLFNGRSWTGSGVTEDIAKEFTKNAGILHLAMHGEVEDEHPLLSRLFFNNSENEDGMLHTYEIYGMTIPAQLVILSACNTATGKLARGEGVLSLERAFHYAGSISLVSTLWTVDDATSSSLTRFFLENIDTGMTKDAALQQAKLKFLSSAPPDKLHPYYWSSFKLSGASHSLKSSGNWIIYVLGTGILFLIAIGFFYRKKRN